MTGLSGAIHQLRSMTRRAGVRTSGKRPPDLAYGLDDVPPVHVIVLGGLQHVGLVTIFLIYPLLIIKELGAPMALATNLLSIALVSLGVATLLQGLPRGPVGSGFLCPANHTAVYLAPSIAAVKSGGLPLLFGMTVLAGLVECALSSALQRIRPLIPPELSGLVIFFVGMTVVSAGFHYVGGAGSAAPTPEDLIVAITTLAVTVALNVWAAGNARVFCALIGMIVGYVTAIALNVLTFSQLATLGDMEFLAIPSFGHVSWSVSADMWPPFVIAALAATLKAVGVLTVCQRTNDTAWLRPDMFSLRRGVLADGLGTATAGVLGSPGLNTSTPCAGLAAATGVTSRVVGYATGGLLVALGFLPMVAGVFVLMPRPVMGASLIFAACFILINGMQTIVARMLDVRRTLVIGLAMSAGIAAELFPQLSTAMPVALQPLTSSSLVLGTITALLLNLLFRLGQRRTATIVVDSQVTDPLTLVKEFFDAQGRSWGARRDVMERVSFGVSQAVETVQDLWEPQGAIEIVARFDEFNLDVRISYRGEPLALPERRPTDREILESEDGHRRLAGYMLRRNADSVAVSRTNDENVLQFHFDH
jgi:xanthine permease XanP